MTGLNKKVYFCSKHRVVTRCYDHLKKLTLLCEGLERSHSEITEMHMMGLSKNVYFCSKHRVVTPCCDCLEKLTLLCAGLKVIH